MDTNYFYWVVLSGFNYNFEIYFGQEKKGILALGTVCHNQTTNCKLPSDKELKKQPRGTSLEFVGNVDGTEASNLAWRDNKIVTMLSSFVWTQPVKDVVHYNRKIKSL